MYPMNGNVSASIGHVQASRLVLSRFADKLHRELVAWGTMGGKGLCGKYLMPVMRKQQYRFQATNPNPATKGRYACQPIGASTTFQSAGQVRSEEHTSELQSLMRISYAVFCLKKKTI